MSILFQKVRLKYYKLAIYFFGFSFMLMSGCRQRTADIQENKIDTVSQTKQNIKETDQNIDSTQISNKEAAQTNKNSSKKTLKTDSTKTKKTRHPAVIIPIKDLEPQPEYGVRYNDYKESLPLDPPSQLNPTSDEQ